MDSSGVLFQALLSAHLIGVALGLGAAAVTDYSFVKAVRMGDRITAETVNWLRTFSQVVWIGIGITILSGAGLLLVDHGSDFAIPGFMAKMVFVGILIVNGLFLNFYSTARLTTFNFTDKYKWRGAAWKARKLSFIFGAISTTSWYAAFLTAMFKSEVGLTFWDFVGTYVAVVILAILSAVLVESFLTSPESPLKHHHASPLASDPTTPIALFKTVLTPSEDIPSISPDAPAVPLADAQSPAAPPEPAPQAIEPEPLRPPEPLPPPAVQVPLSAETAAIPVATDDPVNTMVESYVEAVAPKSKVSRSAYPDGS